MSTKVLFWKGATGCRLLVQFALFVGVCTSCSSLRESGVAEVSPALVQSAVATWLRDEGRRDDVGSYLALWLLQDLEKQDLMYTGNLMTFTKERRWIYCGAGNPHAKKYCVSKSDILVTRMGLLDEFRVINYVFLLTKDKSNNYSVTKYWKERGILMK